MERENISQFEMVGMVEWEVSRVRASVLAGMDEGVLRRRGWIVRTILN